MQASDALRNTIIAGEIKGRLVRHIDELEWIEKGAAKWACAFGLVENSEKLALYICDLDEDCDQQLSVGPRETVMYVQAGSGTVSIAGKEYSVNAGDGIYVRENEQFSLKSNEPLRILMAVCPAGTAPPWETRAHKLAPFNSQFSTRVVSTGTAPSEASGDRSFKILVGPKTGSTAVTQFIGSIPQSRAPEHFHLYEEVICVLSGEGRLWMGEHHVPVRPGSLIFLPREQPHCMECTTPEGMNLLGMFYPAGSPAVNYSTEISE